MKHTAFTLLAFLFPLALLAQADTPSDSVEVRVRVGFILTAKREIKSLKILQNDCKHCGRKSKTQLNKDILDVIRSMPEYQPETSNQGTQNQRYELPIVIRMSREDYNVLTGHAITDP